MKRPAKKQPHPPITSRIVAILGSRYFFLAVAIFFILQMVWTALSGAYPMLFDEEYHLGIIEIYSRQLSPFITLQPPEAAFHGDITRYSSYFFHYLMSFPYRLISEFTDDLTTKVVAMRLICITLVIGGLWLFRKVLLNFGISRATTHSVLFIFTLIPLVSFSLAQINYDALLFVFLGLLLYLTQKATIKSKRQIWYVILFVIASGFAAITKFTVLPVILGCFIFMSIAIYRQYNTRILKIATAQLKELPRPWLLVVSLLLVVSIGLVAERYVINLTTYNALEPKCDVLHADDECLQYTVFRRDSGLRQVFQNKPYTLMNPIQYSTSYWIPHIFNDFFVTGALVSQHKNDLALRNLPTTLEANQGNPLLRNASWDIFLVAMAVIFIAFVRRKLTHKPFFALFGIILVIYTCALWLKNYSDYLSIGTPLAAQGRYYVWLLLPVLAMAALAFKAMIKNTGAYLSLFLISLLLLTQGGGVANYILYSNKTWYWLRYEQTIDQVNANARKVLRSFTLF